MKAKSLLFALLVPAAYATTITDPSLASNQVSQQVDPYLSTPTQIVYETKSDAVGVTFDINVGTQGLGLSLGYEFNQYIKMRLRGAYLSYVYEDTWSDVDGEFDFDGNNAGIIFDYHPFGGEFHLSAGLNFSNFKFKAKGSMQHNRDGASYKFGDYHFVVKGNSASVEAMYDWNNFQPYLGIGWSTDGDGDRSFYVTFDMGVNIIGKGNFSINSTGGLDVYKRGEYLGDATKMIIEDAIREEGKDYFEIADNIVVYPVIQLGLGYRF